MRGCATEYQFLLYLYSYFCYTENAEKPAIKGLGQAFIFSRQGSWYLVLGFKKTYFIVLKRENGGERGIDHNTLRGAVTPSGRLRCGV